MRAWIVMFTGAVPLEEYHRLAESGELQKYRVDAPSRPCSKVLGFTLIVIGLTLLVLVVSGFIGRA